MVGRADHPRGVEGYLVVRGLPARSRLLLVPHGGEQGQSFFHTLYCHDARGSQDYLEPHEPDHRQCRSRGVSRSRPLQTVEFAGKWSGWVREVSRGLGLQIASVDMPTNFSPYEVCKMFIYQYLYKISGKIIRFVGRLEKPSEKAEMKKLSRISMKF
jgi:hypothetical protein